MSKTTDSANRYALAYLADYGFEAEMVRARQRLLSELIQSRRPTTIVEIGCGSESLASVLLSRGSEISKWIIIEPATTFANQATAQLTNDERVVIIPAYAENAIEDVWKHIRDGADMVICSSLLHEVPSPTAVLEAARDMCRIGGIVHVNVPNATSFHRRLAVATGLIENVKTFSGRNVSLEQQRLYDADSLRQAVLNVGLTVTDEGGYFLKPFTHAQMEQILPIVGRDVICGLWTLGRELPTLAAEIYIHAIRTIGADMRQ